MNPDLTQVTNALGRLVAAVQKNTWDHANTVAIVLTLGVVILYTIETSRLRREAQKQTRKTGRLLHEAHQQTVATLELVSEANHQNEVTASLWMEAQRQNEFSVMPLLAIILDTPEVLKLSQQVPGSVTSRLVLRNAGSGPAFNVHIEPYSGDTKVLTFKTDRTVLTPEEERTLTIHFEPEPHNTEIGTPDSLYGWINMGTLPDPFQVTIQCRSVTSIDYRFTFSLTPKAGRLAVIYQGVESNRPAIVTKPGP
jgi:hypothetical protein